MSFLNREPAGKSREEPAVEVAGGSARTEAAASLLRTMMRLNPARMVGVAVEFIDREELRIADALGALIAGGASLGASPDLLGATYRAVSYTHLTLPTSDLV